MMIALRGGNFAAMAGKAAPMRASVISQQRGTGRTCGFIAALYSNRRW
jgi:hypothetical protein